MGSLVVAMTGLESSSHDGIWAAAGYSWATDLVAVYTQGRAELMGRTQYICVNCIA